MHVGGAHNSDMVPNLCQKPSAKFDYGMNGVCKDGAWGSGQLEDHSRPLRDQCAYVSSTSGSTTFPYWSSTDTTKIITFSSMVVVAPHGSQVLIPIVIDWIVECPWDQSPIHSHGPTSLSISSIDDTMDGNPRVWKEMEMNLEVVVQVASYDPFDVKGAKWSKWKGQAHIHHLYILGEQT